MRQRQSFAMCLSGIVLAATGCCHICDCNDGTRIEYTTAPGLGPVTCQFECLEHEGMDTVFSSIGACGETRAAATVMPAPDPISAD